MALWDRIDRKNVKGRQSNAILQRENGLRNSVSQLALTTAIGLLGLPALSSLAWADCVPAGGSNFTCSGATVAPQVINANDASVSTAPGFSINTGPLAIDISGNGAVGFVDQNASSITSTAGSGVSVVAGNPFGTPASIIVYTSGAINVAGSGIFVSLNGVGTSNITSAGTISAGGTGIVVANLFGNGLSINAAAVAGGNNGIFTHNGGEGMTSVSAIGPVSGGSAYGIFAANGLAATDGTGAVVSVGPSTATNLEVNATTVTGGIDGIYAHNNGTGTTSVTATGLVTGTTDTGIRMVSASTTTGATTVSAAGVTGAINGMSVTANGTGPTNVTATGHVTGTAGRGIDVSSYGAGTTVDAASVTGGTDGIVVTAVGAGPVAVTATGQVTGTTSGGIVVRTGPATTGLTVNAAAVSGGGTGILAENQGSGINHVTATGTVTAGIGAGILAFGGPAGSDVLVNAARVTGGTHGIAALNVGSGAIRVVATGTATGSTYGIVAENGIAGIETGTDISIDAVDATGGVGILAKNGGTGSTRVTAAGHVEGTGTFGILAVNGVLTFNPDNTVVLNPDGTPVTGPSTAADLTVSAASVTGVNAGIYAQNNGTGKTDVRATGAVIAGPSGSGIVAVNAATATSMYVTVKDVSGSAAGILARNDGTGATDVIADNVQASAGTAVTAEGKGSRVTVDVASAVGANSGIVALNNGTGGTRIISGGSAGASAHGIDATNAASAAELTVISVGIATGGINGNGIRVRNNGTGATLVSTGALVEGGAAAISAFSAGQPITITAGGLVRNLSQLSTDVAIEGGGGPIDLTNGGGMVGTVQFGAGAHAMTNNAGWNTAGGTNEFGGGASQLTNAAGVAIFAAANGGVAETTAFNGLANFNNHGMFIMTDGGADDRATTGGNLRFEAGSVYAIDIDGTGQSDRITANGAATLAAGSTLTVNMQGSLLYGNRYTVLTADGGVTGTFGSVTGLPQNTAFLAMQDTYDANNAYLDVIKYRDFADAGLTPNQISTGRGLDSIPTVGPLFNAFANLMTDTQARAAFDQLSGEQHASMTSVLLDDSRFVRSAAIDRLRSSFGSVGATPTPVMSYAPGGPVMVPATTDRLVVWGQAFGSWGNLNGDGNAAGVRRTTGGLTFGADALVFDGWRIGLLGGYSNTSISINGRNSSGRSDNYHIGAYAGSQWGNLALRTGVAYTWHDISTSRFVAFPGFTDSLTASYGARTTQVFGDLGYRINMGNSAAIEPFGNLAYVNLHTEGFREIGGPAALTSRGVSTGVTFTTLGLRASSDFALGGTMATIRGSLGWRHAFGDITPMSTFAFAGGTAFGIAGVPIAQNAAVVEAGLDLRLFRNASFGIAYNGQFASSARTQSVKANLSVRF